MSFASNTYTSPNGYIPISTQKGLQTSTKMGATINTEGQGDAGSYFQLDYSNFYDINNSQPEFFIQANNVVGDPVNNTLVLTPASNAGFNFSSNNGMNFEYSFRCNLVDGFRINGTTMGGDSYTPVNYLGGQLTIPQPSAVPSGGDGQAATTQYVLNAIAALKTDPAFIAAIRAAL